MERFLIRHRQCLGRGTLEACMALSPSMVCNMRWEIAIAMIGPLRMTYCGNSAG